LTNSFNHQKFIMLLDEFLMIKTMICDFIKVCISYQTNCITSDPLNCAVNVAWCTQIFLFVFYLCYTRTRMCSWYTVLYSQEMVVHRIAVAMSATIGMIYLFSLLCMHIYAWFVTVIFCSYSIKHFLLSKFLIIKYKTTGIWH